MKETLKGLVTHYSFDHNDENYNVFLDLRKKSESIKNERVLENTAITYFHDFIKDYIKSLGLTPESTYIREDNQIEINFKGIEILNQRDEYTDGYAPEITFTATDKNLTATGHIERTGSYTMHIFDDFLKIAFKNGKDNPKLTLKEIDRDIIQIAPVNQIPRVINAVKTIYESIKGDKFDELIQLYDGLEQLSSDQDHKLPKDIIQKVYNERIRLLLPDNL